LWHGRARHQDERNGYVSKTSFSFHDSFLSQDVPLEIVFGTPISALPLLGLIEGAHAAKSTILDTIGLASTYRPSAKN
jgi:hypothetical protein